MGPRHAAFLKVVDKKRSNSFCTDHQALEEHFVNWNVLLPSLFVTFNQPHSDSGQALLLVPMKLVFWLKGKKAHTKPLLRAYHIHPEEFAFVAT